MRLSINFFQAIRAHKRLFRDSIKSFEHKAYERSQVKLRRFSLENENLPLKEANLGGLGVTQALFQRVPKDTILKQASK